jgi:RHS repeat-associated protein
VRTNPSTGIASSAYLSEPFGDGLLTLFGSNTNDIHYTGKERDAESGLDYFGARYYASNMGRWMSPDPSNWGVDFYNPQTWNHYSYVGNNPLSNTDPNGLWLTPTHNSIIDNAFPGLSKQQRDILKASSKSVDSDQSQEGSYKHGLSSEDNDVYSSTGAYNPTYDTNDFIEQNEHNAKDIQADWIASGHTGIAPAALAAFGNAAHTIADEYSPAHAGFQKVNHWTIGWHILRETTLFGLHKQQQQQAAGAIQNAFFATFGNNAGDQATHEKVTVTIHFDPNQKLPDQQ